MSDNNSSSPWESAVLLSRVAAGDHDAEAEIFERYVERLTRLARSRLAAKLASRFDPEDVVSSAYRSFFMAARRGRFDLRNSGDLWRLLVEVTLHKLYRSAEHHLAQQRSVERERRSTDSTADIISLISRDPTPEEALAASQELESVLQQLDERGRQALELRLQGYELEEIAERLRCNERTVRRAINEARRLLLARGNSNFVLSFARRRPIKSRPKTEPTIVRLEALIASPMSWSDYLLKEQIGAGATGKIYRAAQRAGGPDVAIKFLRKSLISSSVSGERFVREAQTVASLAHPGIVAIHGVGQTPGRGVFLVIELVRGRDLAELASRQPIAVKDAIRWVAEAARTVHFAHEKGVIHCDLKPSNLLLDETGRIRVTDFGMAVRFTEPHSENLLLGGTPAFIAPEQVDPCWGAVSPTTDVWGLGAVLYYLLFRQPPHQGPDVSSVLASVVSRTPITLPDRDEETVPSALVDLLKRCLAKPPNDRLKSAWDLTELLAQILGQL